MTTRSAPGRLSPARQRPAKATAARSSTTGLSNRPSPTTFAARLKQVIGQEPIHGFSKRSGVSDTSLRSYLKGSIPGIDKVVMIAKTAGVNVEWLVTGEGEQLAEADRGDDFAYVPVLDVAASAGTGLLVSEETVQEVIGFDSHWLRSQLHTSPKELSIITVQGDSMAPTLLDGDLIFVDHQVTDWRDGIYVFQMDGDLLIKRLQRLPGGTVSVISDNPKFPPFVVDLNNPACDLTVIGRYRGRISFD